MKRFPHFPLALLLLTSLFGGCEVEDVSNFVDAARCNLRIGVLSGTLFDAKQSAKSVAKALAYFRERNVDAVVLAGDVTQAGTLVQRRQFRALWEKTFPDRRTTLVAVTGERDDPRVYEELSGRPFSPVFSQTVKGYAFIGANWKDATGVDAWALKPLLAGMDKTKPFFYVQNLIPHGTCCPEEGRSDVFDGGKVTYMLSKFPNAVAICGRSQTPLTDEAAFWHGDFTCVHAGTFSCAKMRGPDGAMKTNVRHGLVISLYDTSLVFERLDFGQEAKGSRTAGVHVEKLGPDWKVDLPAAPSVRPATPAPQFWSDTRLMIFPSADVVSLRFPPVLAKHTGVRAYSYEVVARGPDGAEIASMTTWSSGFCFGEAHETKPVTVNFPRAGMPKGRVSFAVTPLDAFGQRGRTITGEVSL